MMHEEFMNLTGITISTRFYTVSIEPEYGDGDWKDKQEFCAQWVKNNKANICKGSSLDIIALSRDIALMDAIRIEANRNREEKDMAVRNKKRAEEQVEILTTANQKLQNNIDSMKEQLGRQEAALDELCSADKKLADMEANYEKALAAKDMEIVKLKAMLFDKMTQVA